MELVRLKLGLTLCLNCLIFLAACARLAPPPSHSGAPRPSLGTTVLAPAALKISPPEAINKLPAPRLEVTREVRNELSKMLRGDGRFIRACVARRDKDYAVLARIFEDEGVPEELINLALIESGYRSEARSSAGAVGMWQFMSHTARTYGLKVDKAKDQRGDLIRSTLAAARHLKDLYYAHQDWYWALAAYNAGSAVANRAGASARSYWEAVRLGKLPRQTAHFVPRFIAATIVVKAIERYGSDGLHKTVTALVAPAPGKEMFALNFEEIGGGSRIPDWSGTGRPSAG